MNAEKWVKENTIHEIVAGSHLYGTSRPDSDIDIRGVCMMPVESLLGLSRFEQYIRTDEQDITIYGLNKFVDLSLGANPNILDILFAPPDKWRIITRQWQQIYSIRHMFLSQKARYTFSGYAVSQLKRLQRHYAWLTNPPDHKPTLEEFDGVLVSDKKGGQRKEFPNSFKEAQYNQAYKHWKQYQTWLKQRNPARAKLEAAYGYDTKHASHLVRLMIKVQGLLASGDYNPVLSDEEKRVVLDVLGGKWEYDYLISWASEQDAIVRNMDSVLPRGPSRNEVERFLIAINREWINNMDP